MLKNKRILLSILVVLALILIPNMVNASNEAPTVSTEVYGTNKSIKVTLSDITLESATNIYKFGVSKQQAQIPTEWLDLQDITTTECEAIVTPANDTMREILRSNNKCYLFVKDITNDSVVITTQIDLSLPLESALSMTKDDNTYEIPYLYRIESLSTDGIGEYSINAVKIDNKEIIKKYLEAKNNNQDKLAAVNDMLPKTIPTTAWKPMTEAVSYDYAYLNDHTLTQYEGLYMIWGQVSYQEGRTIYGYTLYDNYPNDYVLPEDNTPDNNNPDDDTDYEFENYISFPYIIFNGEGSVDLYPNRYNGQYEMYYQFVEISDEIFSKLEELNTKYDNDEITYNEYYTQYYETVTKYNDNNWTKTEDGSFKRDLTEFEGTKKFALWVKLVMDDKTIYEFEIYTMNGSGNGSNVPEGVGGVDEEKETGEPKEEKDPTTATGKIPYTGGTVAIIVSLLVITLVGAYAYKRNKDLKGI